MIFEKMSKKINNIKKKAKKKRCKTILEMASFFINQVQTSDNDKQILKIDSSLSFDTQFESTIE